MGGSSFFREDDVVIYQFFMSFFDIEVSGVHFNLMYVYTVK